MQDSPDALRRRALALLLAGPVIVGLELLPHLRFIEPLTIAARQHQLLRQAEGLRLLMLIRRKIDPDIHLHRHTISSLMVLRLGQQHLIQAGFDLAVRIAQRVHPPAQHRLAHVVNGEVARLEQQRLRGDAVDIWPPYDEWACRVEFWGDVVESIAIIHATSGEVAAKKDEWTAAWKTLDSTLGSGLVAVQTKVDELAKAKKNGWYV